MLHITKDGHVDATRIKVKIFSKIERAKMDKVNGIVVHQTGGSSAESAFSSYSSDGASGAHFLLDLDGTIYQTASLYKRTNHVGKMQSRCIVKHVCSPTDLKAAMKATKSGSSALTIHEMKKSFPDRFPSNTDSIGIEIVGYYKTINGKVIYDNVKDEQNASLKWLVRELADTFKVSMQEIYKHPEIGRKTESEASTAKWD
ncbi:N-acetylmuramoyl-L-alanine amidase [Neisseriaceae bacterium TC5R-5]|nr:N-acetylmuramoyl-L-alanine amidase [Neisseriaceae bacterium TC5R-5]